MGMKDPREIEQTWGSHQPVLQAMIEVMKPQSAIECGCGNYSTPHLQTIPQLHTIEHDVRWASKVCGKYPPSPSHEWTIQVMPGKNPTRMEELSGEENSRIRLFYDTLGYKTAPFDLLFVDTFTACRVPAIMALGKKAKWIVIHDLEPPGCEVYGWPLLEVCVNTWKGYVNKPTGRTKHCRTIAWTGVYSRDPLPLKELNEVVRTESRLLWGTDSILEKVEGEVWDHD